MANATINDILQVALYESINLYKIVMELNEEITAAELSNLFDRIEYFNTESRSKAILSHITNGKQSCTKQQLIDTF